MVIEESFDGWALLDDRRMTIIMITWCKNASYYRHCEGSQVYNNYNIFATTTVSNIPI